MADISDLERTILDAATAGFRLEFVGGLGVWEGPLYFQHQKARSRIQATIRPAAGTTCFHVADVQIRFPDGSHKRPDISIFSRVPDEQNSAVTLLPEAVIEILSEGHEAKDLEVGVPFYRRMNIPDIIIFDPDTKTVLHYVNALPPRKLTSPFEINLACGCTV
jgi:Uma2 family endonuclease